MRDICLFLLFKMCICLIGKFKKNANQGCHDWGDLSELELFSIIKDALGEVTAAHFERTGGWGRGWWGRVGLRERTWNGMLPKDVHNLTPKPVMPSFCMGERDFIDVLNPRTLGRGDPLDC